MFDDYYIAERIKAQQELNKLIDANTEPLVASIYENKKPSISQQAMAMLASANQRTTLERRLAKYEVIEVLDRLIKDTHLMFASPDIREYKIMRELSDFLTSAVNGTKPKLVPQYCDMLPIGHPFSTKSKGTLSDAEVEEYKARWFANDPRVAEEFVPLIASAYKAKENSIEKTYLVKRLESAAVGEVPRDIILELIK